MENTGNQALRKTRQRARFGRVHLVKVGNKFRGMTEFGSEDPGCFFVSAFVTCPMDKVE